MKKITKEYLPIRFYQTIGTGQTSQYSQFLLPYINKDDRDSALIAWADRMEKSTDKNGQFQICFDTLAHGCGGCSIIFTDEFWETQGEFKSLEIFFNRQDLISLKEHIELAIEHTSGDDDEKKALREQLEEEEEESGEI